jgi:hypothetical protein
MTVLWPGGYQILKATAGKKTDAKLAISEEKTGHECRNQWEQNWLTSGAVWNYYEWKAWIWKSSKPEKLPLNWAHAIKWNQTTVSIELSSRYQMKSDNGVHRTELTLSNEIRWRPGVNRTELSLNEYIFVETIPAIKIDSEKWIINETRSFNTLSDMMPAHANNFTMLNVHDMLRSSTAAAPNCYKFQIASQQWRPGAADTI